VASVFEDGASAEGAVNEAQVDVLYRQIGQLKVENDFRTKARQLSRAERRAMVERVNPVSDFCVAALELFGRHGSYQKDMAAAGERLRSKRDRRRSRDLLGPLRTKNH